MHKDTHIFKIQGVEEEDWQTSSYVDLGPYAPLA